jgi:hypothetical protein
MVLEATRKEIADANEAWRKEYIRILTTQVYGAYATASAEAVQSVDGNIDWMVINEAAQKYALEYGKRLTESGSSVIGGKDTPWLKDMSETRRSEVAEIIEKGLAEGKPTGVRETGKGTYPKGSIARDLQDYFGDRQSHASTVARTELGRIQNVSRLDRWGERGWKIVRVQDGDGANPCDACKELNGQAWTLDYARAHELEHPCCVRNFYPLREGEYDLSEVVGF